MEKIWGWLKGAKFMKLFCMPWAGGASYCYDFWQKTVGIKVLPLEYPGHGTRLKETCASNFSALVQDCLYQIVEQHGREPFALFGHSMGALLAYECSRHLQNSDYSPKHLFVSGMCAPSCWEKNCVPIREDENVIERIKLLGGVPTELMAHPELLDFFAPIIKNDYHVLDTYRYFSKNKISCPITVFYGSADRILFSELEKWKEETVKRCDIYKFYGGHFFIKEHYRDIMNTIKTDLCQRSETLDESICYYVNTILNP